MDITYFMTWFISQFITFFTRIFNILDSITMFGFSLLDFCISVFILLPLGINLFIAISKNTALTEKRSYKSTERRKDNAQRKNNS